MCVRVRVDEQGCVYVSVINPRCMLRRVTVVVCVCVCKCLSVTMLAATYLVFTSKMRRLRVLYGVFPIFNLWILLKMLCSKVLVSFTDATAFLTPRRALNRQKSQQRLRRVRIISNRFYYPTDSSLIMAHWQISFLAFCVCLPMHWHT